MGRRFERFKLKHGIRNTILASQDRIEQGEQDVNRFREMLGKMEACPETEGWWLRQMRDVISGMEKT